jgi:DNA repair and recombination protein RAD52
MTDWSKAAVELAKKLDPAHVKPAKKFGPKGDYIEGWHAMAEANAIFGFGGWSYIVTRCDCVVQAPREIGQDRKPGHGVTYVAMVRVTVGDVVREDYGAGHGYDVDLGLAHESAVKEAVTDAMKRALRGFGNRFGLALYDKSRENVGHEDLKPKPRDWEAVRREMMAAIKSHGPRAWNSPKFVADLDAMRKADAEKAAHVEAEIETRKQERNAA